MLTVVQAFDRAPIAEIGLDTAAALERKLSAAASSYGTSAMGARSKAWTTVSILGSLLRIRKGDQAQPTTGVRLRSSSTSTRVFSE